jgi:hypothetical protein
MRRREASLARLEDRMGGALASVVNLLDPDVIVMGGGLSQLDRLYANLPPLIERHLFGGGALATPVLKAKHGQDASGGVACGAASMAVRGSTARAITEDEQKGSQRAHLPHSSSGSLCFSVFSEQITGPAGQVCGRGRRGGCAGGRRRSGG